MIRARTAQAVAGLALTTLGVAGLATVSSGPAVAAERTDSHESMHEMMERMHGEEAVARMHEAEGAEEMMEQCGRMMDGMGGMSNMMNGDGMSGMMNGGMSGMMR